MKTIVQALNVAMTYRVGKIDVPALRGVNLEIQEGEFVSIMGQSGSGKSTLLHILGGLLKPTSGNVVIDGEDLASVTDAQRTDIRRRKIGIVFQRFNLFPTLTAEGNIKLAEYIRHSGSVRDHAEEEKRRRHILKLLKLEDRLHHKPIELSGGEQQRVALARAIINHPAILLADEPTGNLDSENSQIVLDMLTRLNTELGQTVIMITHNAEAAEVGQRLIRMKDGKVLDSRVLRHNFETTEEIVSARK
ncbi:MAG: ABC transporter ATP-binding protein [Blastocatellia bacterium]|nr:ABC transporter ATP-binding protein [Blastocatellia bacterium]